MRLTGRVVKLEARWTAAAPADDADVQLWAQFFASARRWPEDKETTEDHILEVDRRVAREPIQELSADVARDARDGDTPHRNPFGRRPATV